MAENYVVNYSINVNAEKAIQALTAFQTASASLTATFEALKGFEATINSVVGSLQKLSKTKVTLSINTEVTKKKLDTIITKLERINRLASKGATLNTVVSTNNAKGTTTASSAKASSKKAAAATSTNNTPITSLPVKSSIPSARVVADKIWADMFATKWRPTGAFTKNGAASMPSVVSPKISSKAESTASSSAWSKAFSTRAIAGRMWSDAFTNKSWTYPAGSFVKTDSTFVPKSKPSVVGSSQKVRKAGGATSGFNISSKSISSSEAAINKLAGSLNALFDKKYMLQVGGITQVEQGLSRVIAKLQTIETLASKAKLTTRSTSNSGNTKASGSTPIVAGSKAQTPLVRPTTKGGIPLVRNTENIGYKTLGPTPLPSNGGIAVDMLKGMGIAYGISGIGQAISSVVEQATGYDNTMKTVENILKSHDANDDFSGRFQSMSRLVRNVGMETKFTVTQVADAAKFLAMAGLDVDAIQKSIRPIADIALVGDTDLGETADLVTNVMTAYNIAPSKMRQAADVMTNTFTMSNTTLSEIAESYKYAASILSAGGVGFEEATAAIGVLGDAGIKGSQAGTTMRTIMANVVNPTKKQAKAWKAVGVSTKDKDGQARPLLEIFQELNEKNLNVADYYKLFHKTAASGAIALADHVDKWNNVYLENFISGGLSAKLADEKKNTLQGKWAQVTSTFTDTGVTAFQNIQGNLQLWMDQAINWLRSDEAAQVFKDIADTMVEFVQTLIEATKWFKTLYDIFAPLIKLWVKFQLVIWPVVKGIQAFKSVWLGLKGFGAIGSSIVGVTRGMLGLAEASREAAAAGAMVGSAPVASAASRKAWHLWGSNKYVGSKKDWLKTVVGRPYRSAATGLLGEQAYLIPGSNEAINRLSEKRQKWRNLRKDALSKAKQWGALAILPDNTLEDFRYAQQQQHAYLKAADRAKAKIDELQGDKKFKNSWKSDVKQHYQQNIKPNILPTITGIGGMAGGAAGSMLMMHQMTKENATGYDYTSGGLYGLAGMAAMTGNPAGLAIGAALGVAGLFTQWIGAMDQLSRLEDSLKSFSYTNQLIDGTLTNSSTRTEQVLETVWRKNIDINTLLERRIELSKQLYGIESPEATTTKDVGTSVFNDFFKKFDAADSMLTGSSGAAEKAANLLNTYGTDYGISISKTGGDWALNLPGGKTIYYNNPDGTSDTNDAVMYDVAAAMEMLHGQYRSKIIDENQKRLSQMLYGKSTASDVLTWRDTFQKSYNPQNIPGLVTPDKLNASKEEAQNWNGQEIAKSYLGAYLMWQSLENVRKGQDVIAEFKTKLANKTYDEGDVVNALRYGDYNIMGPLLRDYYPNNIAEWFGNQGYQNGRWVSVNGETPEAMAQMAVGNMQKLLDSIRQLGLASDPATEGIRTYANVLLTLGQSFLGAADEVSGKKDGETKTVNGQKWRWNNSTKLWELVDDDDQLSKTATGITALSNSIKDLQSALAGSNFTIPFVQWGDMPSTGLVPMSTPEFESDSYTGLKNKGVRGITPVPWSPNANPSNALQSYPRLFGQNVNKKNKDKPVTMTAQQMGNALGGGANSKNRGLGSGDNSNNGRGRNAPKASDYKNHYNKNNAAPKQVIVRINNLMNVDKVDLSNPNNAAVVANLKSELAQALVDVVHDFDETWHG